MTNLTQFVSVTSISQLITRYFIKHLDHLDLIINFNILLYYVFILHPIIPDH